MAGLKYLMPKIGITKKGDMTMTTKMMLIVVMVRRCYLPDKSNNINANQIDNGEKHYQAYKAVTIKI